MNTEAHLTPASPSRKVSSPAVPRPNVFDYSDYRLFLKDFYSFKRATLPSYSMSTFVRRAGLGENSRGYLKMIIEGKRNLTPHTLRRFVDALGLSAKEGLFFENLVYLNQAKTPSDREFYFHRLNAAAEGSETTQLELLQAQYDYYSNWYLVAVRELVALDSFKEDPAWISAQLRGKINRKQAQDAIDQLLKLNLISRSPQGKLEQSEPLVKFKGGFFSGVIQKFQLEMMDRAREAILEDAYEERNASSVTLSCDVDRMPELLERICEFRDQLNREFGTGSAKTDSVLQVNFQLFQLTSPKRPARRSKTLTPPSPRKGVKP